MKLLTKFKKLSKKAKAFVLGGTVTAILAAYGIYSMIKDVVPEIKNIVTPKTYKVCEQDGNIRGIFLENTDIKDSKHIELKLGIQEKVMTMKFLLDQFQNHEYYYLFSGIIDQECNFKWRLSKNNQLLFSIEIYDEYHCLVGKVDESMFVLNKDCQFTWNSDKYGFEIIDNNFNVVVSFDYRPPKTMAFQGIAQYNEQHVLVHNNKLIMLDKLDNKEKRNIRKKLKPIFEYVGNDWFGKRALIK